MPRVATCLWRVTPEVISALAGRFGDPVDAYVNGGQTWLRGDGPGEVAVEWRLHPVPGYQRPEECSHHAVFGTVARSLAGDGTAPAPGDLWDGLEAYPAYEDDVEPAPLAAAMTDALGIAPDAVGLVDHEGVADAWERSGGTVSVTDALFAQLAPG